MKSRIQNRESRIQNSSYVTQIICVICVICGQSSAQSTAPAPKPTLAVLPFVGVDAKEKQLADKMRFAFSQKMSNDADGGGTYNRLDNVQIDQTISALQIIFNGKSDGTGGLPDHDELTKLLETLGTDKAVTGYVKGRKLTVLYFEGTKLAKTASAEIPGERDSPKLTVEGLITQLTGAKFQHIREVEADHSNPEVEKRFAERPNLVPDPDFEAAAKNEKKRATNWQTILLADRYPPPLLTADEAAKLGKDKVAIVPKKLAGDPDNADGHCLMMRISKHIAENNGLACESIWIPVEHGATYRFQVKYRSTGPVPRLFLKGFAYKPDQFGDKNDPEAARREFYRAQVLPRDKNAKFELVEMDFTPSVADPNAKGDLMSGGGTKAAGMKIEWLRVDLYIYLSPGDVFFDDVIVKKISP